MRPYVYRECLPTIRECLDQGLNELRWPFEDALGYTIVECSLLEGDALWRVLEVTALAKVALEFDYVKTFESTLGDTDLLTAEVRRHAPIELAVTVSESLRDEQDRDAFLKDFAEVRSALKIS